MMSQNYDTTESTSFALINLSALHESHDILRKEAALVIRRPFSREFSSYENGVKTINVGDIELATIKFRGIKITYQYDVNTTTIYVEIPVVGTMTTTVKVYLTQERKALISEMYKKLLNSEAKLNEEDACVNTIGFIGTVFHELYYIPQ